jgi:glycogen(starch) synthase
MVPVVRVLMLTWEFPPDASGGIAAHVAGLSDALVDAGHEVVVLTIDERRRLPTIERTDAGLLVLRAWVGGLPWLPPTEPIARTASANHALVALTGHLRHELGGWEPDIVHGHDWRVGWAADTLATVHAVPFVLTMHGTERIRHGGNLPQGAPSDINSVEWWLAFRANRLIASTRFMVEQLVTSFELPQERVVRVPNGIDPAMWYARLPGGSREPLVLSWGRVQYEKGFQVLARAMQLLRGRVPGISCTIAGRGSYLPELQTQVDVEGVSDLVDLPGFVHDEELHQLLARAGCVVIPSLYEPFGLVALEALAAGAPLIVAHTGGLAEMVDGTKAALTFEPGNPDELADRIERVLTDPDLADDLTAHAENVVTRRYAWHAIAASTVEVYESVRHAG